MGSSVRLAGRRVLVVEDDWFIASYVGDALEAAGAALVGPVATAGKALRLLEEGAPDAATLNVTLADGDSLPVARRLAELDVPFVFLSAVAATVLPPEMRRRPMLAKPFGGYQVVDAVIGMLEVQA